MTRDEIIKLAREAASPDMIDAHRMRVRWTLMQEELERFAALVAAAEREACAKVCEQPGKQYRLGWECAAAIRARKET
jgi:hypothetical protein